MLKKGIAAAAGAILLAALVLAIVPLHGGRAPAQPRVLSAVRGAGPLAAGGAALPLAPPPGVPIGGYPRLRWASEGVADAPMVRALVLSDGGASIAVASVEVLVVPAALRRKVEERVAGLRLDALLLAATHTHSGPGGFWDDALGSRLATGPHDPAVEEALADRVADAVRAAAAARAPARLAVSGTRLPELVRNRNGGEVGAGLTAVRVERTDGSLVGQVVVFPAHATVRESRDRRLSGDWPGAMARALPGVTVFLQGAEGDQTWVLPPPHPPGPVHEAYGRRVAGAVERLPWPPGDPAPALGAAAAEVTLPAPSFGAVPPALDRLLANLLWRWLPERSRVLVLRLGALELLAVPAEPGAAVGRAWRASLGPGVEVVSLAGDYLGYVETPEAVRARTGEARRTYLGPGLEPALRDGLAAAKGALDGAGR